MYVWGRRKVPQILVGKRRIQPNLDKVREILNTSPSTMLKEVQKLNGKINVLSRFISKFADKCMSFFPATEARRGRQENHMDNRM